MARLNDKVQRVVHQAHALEEGDVLGYVAVYFVDGFLRQVNHALAAVDLLLDDRLVHDGEVDVLQDGVADRQSGPVRAAIFVLASYTDDGGLARFCRGAESCQLFFIVLLYSQ